MNPSELQQLRARLVQDLALEALPEPAQDVVLERLTGNIILAITRATETRLPIGLQTEFERLKGTEDEAGMKTFLEQAIPDYAKLVQNVIQGTVADFKKSSPTAV